MTVSAHMPFSSTFAKRSPSRITMSPYRTSVTPSAPCDRNTTHWYELRAETAHISPKRDPLPYRRRLSAYDRITVARLCRAALV